MSAPTHRSVVCVKERFGYVSTLVPLSVVPEIEGFGYVKTPVDVSVIPFEGDVWLYENVYSFVYYFY